jgi:ABC-type transport system involved in cytochrome bd biosynthesis fused ATPase/permease subunit
MGEQSVPALHSLIFRRNSDNWVFPMTALCVAFAVKRSGYHAWVKAEASARADAALRVQIRTVYQQHGAATARRASWRNWRPTATGTGANASRG